MRSLLGELGRTTWMASFYLAGGTALALQLGHRRSIDLDFFTAIDPLDAASRRRIIDALAVHDPHAIEDVEGNLVLRLGDALHVAFLSYGYPLLDPPLAVEGVAVASIRDVGLMKLDAVISRGSRKDFVDLYFVSQRMPIDGLLDDAEAKYPFSRDFPLMAVTSLVRFENADIDAPPEMLVEIRWEDVRAFFASEVRRLGERWLGDRE